MPKLSEIIVLDKENSVRYILENQSSVARFGDGEVDIIMGKSIPYQPYSPELASELMDILQTASSEKLLVCLPDVFSKIERYNTSAQKFWENHFKEYGSFYEQHMTSEWYGSTFLSRPYIDLKDKSSVADYFTILRSVWEDRDVLIVEGATSRSGVGNDLFDNVKRVRRIIGPSKDAYSKIEVLYESILRNVEKDTLILLMLGPTAKILAARLSQIGHQAIDLGHIDSEYEWFQRKAQYKIKLENKHTAEHNSDHFIVLEEDQEYASQIIEDVSGVLNAAHYGKISIIIPVYNSEAYLKRCVDSILNQSYQNFEILLINDGSTDRSAAICEEYAQKDLRIKVIHQANQGPSSARNLGIRHATGDYLSFIDSDDFVDEKFLETLVTHLVDNNADIASTNFASFNEERQSFLFFTYEETYFEKCYTPEEWLACENESRHNLFLVVIFPVLKLYRKYLFDGIEFPVGRVREDDAIFYKLSLRAKSIAFVNAGLYFYTQRPESLSKTVMLDDIATMVSNAEERIALLAAMGYDLTPHLNSYIERLKKCCTDALNSGQMQLYHDIKVKLELIESQKGDTL